MKKTNKLKKILVIDDQKSILEVIKIVLEEEGYTVEILSKTENIYTTVNEYMPDLILLDIWMPGLNGKAVAKKIKTEKSTKHIPIIVISALNKVENIVKEMEVEDFLAKPFDIYELIKKVNKHTKNSNTLN